MPASDQVEQAIKAIGPMQDDDWKIDPVAHVSQLGSEAPELCAVLQRSEVSRTAAEYVDKGREAVRSQKCYVRTAERANQAILVSGCIAALVMCLGTLINDDKDLSWWFAILGILGIGTGALAAMWLSRVRDGEMLRHWTHSRARAEAMRLDYFRAVLQAEPGENDNPTRLTLLKLEYFRRFLLDSQLSYFRVRTGQHQESADRCLSQTTRWTCIATVMTGSAGLLAAKFPDLAALAAGGIAATAVASMFSNREFLSQHQANSQRYSNTREKLFDIAKQLTATRELILTGHAEVLRSIYEATREVLMSEHSQWLEGTKRIDLAIERLEGQLDDIRNKPTQA